MHRFYHDTGVPESGDVALDRDESHHAMRVLRVRQGDEVTLFDGQGRFWLGAISEVSRNEVRVHVASERHSPRPEPPVALLQAWLHRDKLLDDLVRQATVLGAAEIHFFRADHSEKKPRLSEKWRRLCIEACKQCGRLWLPQVSIHRDLAAALEAVGGHRLIIARMEGPHVPLTRVAGPDPVACLIGPEGDFSPEERAAAAGAGALPISLGSTTFRAEMAAQVTLTLVQHHLGHVGAT